MQPAVPEGEDDTDKDWLRKQYWDEADPAYTDASLPVVPLWRDIVRGDVEDDKVENDLGMGGLCFLLIYLCKYTRNPHRNLITRDVSDRFA